MAGRRQAQTWSGWVMAAALTASLAGCGGGGWFGGGERAAPMQDDPFAEGRDREGARAGAGSVWDLFANVSPPGVTVEVNRYLWNAALEVLDFLPVETVDPFSGVIVTGFGRPPGGGTEYRAAVLVSDPALDARSVHVALMTRGGPASPATVRAVEDAIMTRARQLRVRDGRL